MIDVQKAFAYETWASRRILARLREIPNLSPEILELFAHIQSGLKVWITRIRGEDSGTIPIWPDLLLDDCERLLDQNARDYTALLANSPPKLLESTVSYTNQHGLPYDTKVGDILAHLLTHGSYHRGQIGRLLRQGGHEPVNTDYITYVREVAGEPWRP